ncbi:hypothetical protein TNCV_3765901 [Trichonephila clavipes]|nr:hypothetical protein TNCV_3765901 [Trichonephila clavipes]
MELKWREVFSSSFCTRDSAHKTFRPTDLTSPYSMCTRRVFGVAGIEPRPSGPESGVLTISLYSLLSVSCGIFSTLFAVVARFIRGYIRKIDVNRNIQYNHRRIRPLLQTMIQHRREQMRCFPFHLFQAEPAPEPYEISNVIEKVVDIARKINLEVDSDDFQKLLDSQSQNLAIDELIEIHEQEQDIEEFVFKPSSIKRSNNGWKCDGRPRFS